MLRLALVVVAVCCLAGCPGGDPEVPDGGTGADALDLDGAPASDADLGSDGSPHGADVTFTPVVLPLTGAEIGNPMRGSYRWLGVDPEPAGWPTLDSYMRYTWKELEPTRDGYDFSRIDSELAAAEARGGKLGLRVMPACTGCRDQADSMPDYMHDLMPLGFWFDQDGTHNYAPDWNDPDYLDRLEQLLAALADHLGDDPRFGFLDLSCYGNWGEWHSWMWPYPAPTGAVDITDENARAIVDLNVTHFPTKRIVMPNDHDVALAYAMSLSTRIGVRNDCLGFEWFTQANSAEAPVTGDRWMTAPLITEYCYQEPGSGGFAMAVGQVSQFHVAMIGNGNRAALVDYTSAEQEAYLQANRLAGYRFELRNVTLPGELGAGHGFTVASSWANVGVTPAYTPWNVELSLRVDDGAAAAWTGVSTLDLEAFLPAAEPRSVQDSFELPSTLSPGTYQLVVTVRDRDGYYAPLSLANEGRDASGSYVLGEVTVI